MSEPDLFKKSIKESTLTLIILALILVIIYIVREGPFSSYLFSTPQFVKENIKQNATKYIQIEGHGIYMFSSEKEVTIKEVLDRSGLDYSAASINNWNSKLESGAKIIMGPDMAISIGHMDGGKRLLFDLPIDINNATFEDLEALPGIGEGLGQRIVKYRDTNGPFKSVDDLRRVHGIGEKKLANIKELISASDSSYEITYSQQRP